MRRWTAIAAGVLLLVLLGVVVGIWLSNRGTESVSAPTEPTTPGEGHQVTAPPARTTSPGTTTDPVETSDDAAPSGVVTEAGCGGEPPADPEDLTVPPEVTWRMVQGVALPFSAEFGPAQEEPGPLFTCFHPSATGAILAAYHIVPRTYSSEAVVELQITDGNGRDQVLAELQRTGPRGPGGTQLVGFGVDSVAAETVRLTLVSRRADGGMVGVPVEMRWVEEDWKMSGDDNLPRPFTVTSLVGYVPFSGVR